MGRSNERSSMPAVITMRPVWRCAQIAAQRSIQARICPPNTPPIEFACVGSTNSVMVVTEWEAGRGDVMSAGIRAGYHNPDEIWRRPAALGYVDDMNQPPGNGYPPGNPY